MKLTITRIYLSLACIALLLLFSSSNVFAGNVNVGKVKSSGCKRCHGQNGISKNPKYPNLAGQKEEYLIKAMKAYKNGGRDDTTMRSIILGLSDSSIKDIAAYYSSIKIKIKK